MHPQSSSHFWLRIPQAGFRWSLRHYCTAMVTVLLATSPEVIVTGTAEPGVTPSGSSTLICHKPTQPGAMPLNRTDAATPPMFTVGRALVFTKGLPLPPAASPAARIGVVAPPPVAKIAITVP